MHTMTDIHKLAEKLAAVRDALAGVAMAHEDDISAVRNKYAARIRSLTAQFRAAAGNLSTAVAESHALFERPRSIVAHGIKCGWQKGKGKITWADDARVCALIRRWHPDQADVLIRTTETPVAGALNELPSADLRKLGVEIDGTEDAPFVKLADTEIAKTINALLRQGDAA